MLYNIILGLSGILASVMRMSQSISGRAGHKARTFAPGAFKMGTRRTIPVDPKERMYLPVLRYTFPTDVANLSQLWKPDTIADYYKEAGYDASEFIAQMSFNSLPVDINGATEPVFDADRGKCFLVDVKGQQKVAGIGLSLVIGEVMIVVDPGFGFRAHQP